MGQTVDDTHAVYLRLMQDSLAAVERSGVVMLQVAETINAAHNYRVYLLDTLDHICAAESFSVVGDKAAGDVAAYIFDSCSDTFKSYELWRGASRIVEGNARLGIPDTETAISEHQNTVADLEERLQRAFSCVNRSRRLFEAAVRLRKQVETSRYSSSGFKSLKTL